MGIFGLNTSLVISIATAGDKKQNPRPYQPSLPKTATSKQTWALFGPF